MDWIVEQTIRYYIKDCASKVDAEHKFLNEESEKIYQDYSISPLPTMEEEENSQVSELNC